MARQATGRSVREPFPVFFVGARQQIEEGVEAAIEGAAAGAEWCRRAYAE